MNDDGTISSIMEERLIGALSVITPLKIDKIICSGGIANKIAGISEASKMKEYLISHGVGEEMIIMEDKSHTTVENMKFSSPIIQNLHPDDVILLSSVSHLSRNFLNPVDLFKKEMPDVKLIIYGV